MQYYSIKIYDSSGLEFWSSNYNEWISTTEQRSDKHTIVLEEGIYYIQIDGSGYWGWEASTGNYNFSVIEGSGMITGDINGDDDINVLDLLALKRHILKINILFDEKLTAADINGDGRADVLDLLSIKKHILKLELLY